MALGKWPSREMPAGFYWKEGPVWPLADRRNSQAGFPPIIPLDPAGEESTSGFPLAEIVVHPVAANLSPTLHQRFGKSGGTMSRHSQLVQRGRSMTLPDCDGKEVTVVLTLAGRARTLHGKATYLTDPMLGNCLSVKVDDPNSFGAELLLREDEWTGRIEPSTSPDSFATIYLETEAAP